MGDVSLRPMGQMSETRFTPHPRLVSVMTTTTVSRHQEWRPKGKRTYVDAHTPRKSAGCRVISHPRRGVQLVRVESLSPESGSAASDVAWRTAMAASSLRSRLPLPRSRVGPRRARGSQSGGRRFDPGVVHQLSGIQVTCRGGWRRLGGNVRGPLLASPAEPRLDQPALGIW